ncbi:MAG: hypothetical protein Q9190_001144 [Brigantiaea leucoxantha]
MPNIKLKLPSRNWSIFLVAVGSVTTAILYDRYHKKRIQQRWCNTVSHIAQEPLSTNQLPRKITIFLAAPPGDSLRAAREHFHEYVKPVLVAGALDWDVVEGRKEGDVRAGLAEKIRKFRKESGETSEGASEPKQEKDVDQIQLLRSSVGTREWEGVQGDLVLGRHTWKEYVQGLHEGWLGPLDPPPSPSEIPDPTAAVDMPSQEGDSSSNLPTQADPSLPEPAKPQSPLELGPYIMPSAYPTASLPHSIPESFSPSLLLPFPHLLGFLNTPIRIYRFLNRRYLANETGRSVASIVLASNNQPYTLHSESISATDSEASPAAGMDTSIVMEDLQRWEQQDLLKDEETDWHKSAWNGEDEGEGKRVWREKIIVDERLGRRMSQFVLSVGEEEKARADDGRSKDAQSLFDQLREWAGWGAELGPRGWEDGLVSEEDEEQRMR